MVVLSVAEEGGGRGRCARSTGFSMLNSVYPYFYVQCNAVVWRINTNRAQGPVISDCSYPTADCRLELPVFKYATFQLPAPPPPITTTMPFEACFTGEPCQLPQLQCHVSDIEQVWTPQLFYTHLYNHAHRLRLEKLLYLTFRK